MDIDGVENPAASPRPVGLPVTSLQMRDLSRTGHELGHAHLDGLPTVVSLGELLRIRINADVARYNAELGPVFEGLVQPADSVRHSDGHHMNAPRHLDADQLIAAAEQAVEAGVLWFIVGDEETSDLSREIEVEQHERVIAVLGRPVVARVG